MGIEVKSDGIFTEWLKRFGLVRVRNQGTMVTDDLKVDLQDVRRFKCIGFGLSGRTDVPTRKNTQKEEGELLWW